MTKGTPYMLFVSDSTKSLLTEAEAEELVYIDEVEVRGRTTKIKLWALPTPDPLAPQPEPEPKAEPDPAAELAE